MAHYGSNKCKHISQSVMVAEVHSLVLRFDMEYAVRDLTEDMLGRCVTF